MTGIASALRLNPNWRVVRGYAYGMSQSSMIAVETFPDGPEADAVTVVFLDVIGRMLGQSLTATAPQIDPTLTGGIATASALAVASSSLQVSVYLPVASDFRLSPVAAPGHKGSLLLILPWWRIDAAKTSYAFCAELWNRLAAGEIFDDVAPLSARLNDHLAPFVSQSVNEYSLIKGITDLGINLSRMTGDVLCLGTGVRSRWMSSTTTDATSGISLRVARNKIYTGDILRLAGLPGAENHVVSNSDEAVAAAKRFDCPVVVKPFDLDRGDGVAADLRTEAEIRAAFEAARAISRNVMVEKMIPGVTHRLTVAAGDVISVRQRVPGGITGDGTSTIAELVAKTNTSERSIRLQRVRGKPQIDLDAEALELMSRDGFTEDSVLTDGQFLRLRRRDNINAGGENRDLELSDVHSDNLDLAATAARILRLDIAGIDLITTDISRSWREVGAGICEVNGRPQFASYRTPEIFHEIINRVVGHNPHVQASLVLCADDPAVRAAIIAAVKGLSPRRTVTTQDGLWRNGTLLTNPFRNGFAAAIAGASRTDTEALTCVMSMRELLSEGSPLRRWDHISIRKFGMSEKERALMPAVRAVLGATRANAPAADGTPVSMQMKAQTQ